MNRGAWQGSMGLIVHEVARVRHNLTKPAPVNRKHYRDTKQNAFPLGFVLLCFLKELVALHTANLSVSLLPQLTPCGNKE